MTTAIVAGAITLLFVVLLDRVLVAFARERTSWSQRIDGLVTAQAGERQEERAKQDDAMQALLDHLKTVEAAATEDRRELLTRIQHPEVRPVAPGPFVPAELPRDPAEMAFIGQEVPEFVTVGSAEQMMREEAEIAKVGTIDNGDGEG